jgi:hypothetical protein
MGNVYQNALDVQNACNVSGVLRSLARDTDAIWEEARAAGQGTDYVNRHPAIILTLHQLLFLSIGGGLDTDTFLAAWNACEAGAKVAATV